MPTSWRPPWRRSSSAATRSTLFSSSWKDRLDRDAYRARRSSTHVSRSHLLNLAWHRARAGRRSKPWPDRRRRPLHAPAADVRRGAPRRWSPSTICTFSIEPEGTARGDPARLPGSCRRPRATRGRRRRHLAYTARRRSETRLRRASRSDCDLPAGRAALAPRRSDLPRAWAHCCSSAAQSRARMSPDCWRLRALLRDVPDAPPLSWQGGLPRRSHRSAGSSSARSQRDVSSISATSANAIAAISTTGLDGRRALARRRLRDARPRSHDAGRSRRRLQPRRAAGSGRRCAARSSILRQTARLADAMDRLLSDRRLRRDWSRPDLQRAALFTLATRVRASCAEAYAEAVDTPGDSGRDHTAADWRRRARARLATRPASAAILASCCGAGRCGRTRPPALRAVRARAAAAVDCRRCRRGPHRCPAAAARGGSRRTCAAPRSRDRLDRLLRACLHGAAGLAFRWR